MELRTRARERLVEEWLQTSNYWDPIRDRNEAFEIVDIRGFKELGRRVTILYNINRGYWMRMMISGGISRDERETIATSGLVSYM